MNISTRNAELGTMATVTIALAAGIGFSAVAHGPKHNSVRHQFMMKNGLPPIYSNISNPLKNENPVRLAGNNLFAEHCASCHGATGNGDGEAGADLNPKPPELRSMIGMPMANDGYFMWAISQGGEALGTGMPAFKDALSETERWQIIGYMQSGFKN